VIVALGEAGLAPTAGGGISVCEPENAVRRELGDAAAPQRVTASGMGRGTCGGSRVCTLLWIGARARVWRTV
jgi:hypothetical protein